VFLILVADTVTALTTTAALAVHARRVTQEVLPTADPNVCSALTVLLTWLAFDKNVSTLASAFAGRTLFAKL
jgi:hypothetical protein